MMNSGKHRTGLSAVSAPMKPIDDIQVPTSVSMRRAQGTGGSGGRNASLVDELPADSLLATRRPTPLDNNTAPIPNTNSNHNSQFLRTSSSGGDLMRLKHPPSLANKTLPATTAKSPALPPALATKKEIKSTSVVAVDSPNPNPSLALHQPLLPSDHHYPLFRDGQTSATVEVLKGGKWDDKKRNGIADVVEMSAANEAEQGNHHIVPIINGQPTEIQIPSYYQPPPALVPPKKSKKRQILSSREVNVLLLHVARLGDLNSLRSITRSPRVDVNLVDDEGRTAIIFAAIGGHLECVQLLIERGALIHQADYSGRTALHWAAQYGHATIIHMLLRSGANMMNDDYQGRTALHCSMAAENPAALQILLKHLAGSKVVGAGINFADDDGMTPLMWAAYHGHYNHMRLLLAHKADPILRDVEGKTALHWTTTNKHVQCVMLLVKQRSDMSGMRDRYGRTALHLACAEGNISIVYFLLALNPAIVNEKDDVERTSLHWSAICGKASIVKLLCEFGARLNKVDKYGATALHYAAQQNFQDCVHVLLRKGAAVHCQDKVGRQPLIWASIQGHIDIMKMLMTAKADVNSREEHGLAALHFSAYAGHTACCLYLIRNGADMNAVDYKNHTPIFRAAMAGHTETVLALISEGGDVNMQDLAGRTVLHWACSAGHIDVVNILVGYGADIGLPDKKGATPLHEAAFHGKTDVMVYLFSRGANVNVKDVNGVTPIHWASVNGHINCCRLLLANGANVNAMVFDEDRDTPLDYAFLNNNYECAQFLIDHGAVAAEEILKRAANIIKAAWVRYKGTEKVIFHPPLPKLGDHRDTASKMQKLFRGAVFKQKMEDDSAEKSEHDNPFAQLRAAREKTVHSTVTMTTTKPTGAAGLPTSPIVATSTAFSRIANKERALRSASSVSIIEKSVTGPSSAALEKR